MLQSQPARPHCCVHTPEFLSLDPTPTILASLSPCWPQCNFRPLHGTRWALVKRAWPGAQVRMDVAGQQADTVQVLPTCRQTSRAYDLPAHTPDLQCICCTLQPTVLLIRRADNSSQLSALYACINGSTHSLGVSTDARLHEQPLS